MFHGVFALLERSLRVDSRAWSSHLARLGLIGAIYCSLCYALITSSMFGAPGLNFFRGIAYLDATFMTLLGVSFFATSITEEKEEDTLGLMLMAGISPLGILVGKSGGRLWQSLLLIAVQYPFVLLAVTMGGVMAAQITAVTVALLAYMVFLSGFGLLCSTSAPRSQAAVAWMVVGLCVYCLVPVLAKEHYLSHATWLIKQSGSRATATAYWTLIEWTSNVCIFVAIQDLMTTGVGGSFLSVQVISNLSAGILCAGLSWLLFGLATRDPATEATSRGLVTRRTLSAFSTGAGTNRLSSFRPAPCTWSNPFIWKDFHFVSGGAGMLIVRTIYFGYLGITALAIENKHDGYMMGWFYLTMFILWLSVTIDAARVLSRSMQDEVRGQTLSSLMMLPRSPVGIVYSKFAGALIGWLPGPMIALAVTIVSPANRECLVELTARQQGFGLLLITLVLYFSLIPHFAAVLSLYVRWGAVALAIGLTIGLYFGLIMVVMLSWFVFGNVAFFSGPDGQIPVFLLVDLGLFGLCVACHIVVLLRVQSLAMK